MTESGYEVVIVGGGVMGLSIAERLGRRGVRPLVLERRSLGAGSTGKSGAILRQHYSVELAAAMARDSLRTYAAFEEEVGGSAGFVNCGMALIVGSEDREGLDRNLEMQDRLGIRSEPVDGVALAELVPGLAGHEEVVGSYEPDAGYADPMMTLAALAAAVRRAGGTIREETEVAGFVEDDGRVTGVETRDGEVISGDRIVVAAGPWSGRVMGWLGWESPVDAVRVQTAMFRRPLDYDGGPVVIDFPNEMHAKHAAETHVGSISPLEISSVDPDNYDEGVDGAYVELAHERLARRLPVMGHAQRFGGYGALYAITPDWYPVIGPAGAEGLYLCAGFSGHGFKLAPAIGGTVAAELLDEDSPYDVEPLRPDRFERGEPVSGAYSYSVMG